MNVPFRIGHGYDIHALVPGRRLVLGGVDIPHTHGLLGHSDADALTHAVCDALLGAASLPDIGHWFPNTDPRWKDAASLDLLAVVAARVRASGWEPVNVDATLLCELPRLRPHIDAMRTHLARAAGIDAACVGVKATTNEGQDAVGRGEAIAAHAVCLLAARSGEPGTVFA